jgi:DNA-binding PadR family transcriptional regulator
MEDHDVMSESARPLTPAEVAVLGLLVEKPRSGYEISTVVQERGMREWTDLASSSIYAILKRLVAMGLVQATTEVVANRARSIHTPTDEGRRRLTESVESLLEVVARPLNDLDVGIANIPCLPAARVRELLRKRQEALEQAIKRLEAAKTERSAAAPYFVRALFDRPLAQLRAERNWLTSLIDDVEEVR